MKLINNSLPCKAKDFQEKYPKAYQYFIDKNPMVLAFHPAWIELQDNFGKLRYDKQDVEFFNQDIDSQVEKILDVGRNYFSSRHDSADTNDFCNSVKEILTNQKL